LGQAINVTPSVEQANKLFGQNLPFVIVGIQDCKKEFTRIRVNGQDNGATWHRFEFALDMAMSRNVAATTSPAVPVIDDRLLGDTVCDIINTNYQAFLGAGLEGICRIDADRERQLSGNSRNPFKMCADAFTLDPGSY
jgi:hypothetical protein